MLFDRQILPSLAAFCEVARVGGFTPAAERLGVSPSALSQNIRALEERLGVQLLKRSTRSVTLTEKGRRLLAQIEPNIAAIGYAIGGLKESGDKPSGEVRISVPRVVSRRFIEPRLGDFARRYPLVRLELEVDDGMGDILLEGCDAGIRLREAVPDSMIAVPVTPPVSLAVVASPAYFAANPPPSTPSDLSRHKCVGYRQLTRGNIYRWEFTDPDDEHDLSVDPEGGFATNDVDTMLNLALQGVGLVMHMDFAVSDHIASGALLRVLDAWCPPFDGFQLYIPARESLPAKLAAVAEFFAERQRLKSPHE